jgi:hypothetical protein
MCKIHYVNFPSRYFQVFWVYELPSQSGPISLVKFDFLGLKTFTELEKAIRLIRNLDIRRFSGHAKKNGATAG